MGVSLRCASGRRATGYASLRYFAALRTAHAPSACLTQQLLDVLPRLHAWPCFTLFDAHYQALTKLKFFIL
ncbi:MAG: hypothetical protein RML94_04985, partial [Bacteroidia bacterium]|nr:hypothetical protein [Bacteroidia bacterium]